MSDQTGASSFTPADTGPAADAAPDAGDADLASRVAALESRVGVLEAAGDVAQPAAVAAVVAPVYPNLTEGDHGQDVQKLAALLADNGYPNAVERGEAVPVLTTELMDMVARFQAEHDYSSPLGRGVDTPTWRLLHGAPALNEEGDQ